MKLRSLATFAILAAIIAQVSCRNDDLLGDSRIQSYSDAVTEPLYVRLPQSMLSKEFVQRTQFNRDHKYDEIFAFGYLSEMAFDALPADERAEIIQLSAAWQHVDFDPRSLRIRSGEELTIDGKFEGYHNYLAMTAELERIANDYPEIVQLTSAGKSVQGRELWLLKLSDQVAMEEDEPKLLYIANMHGDEVVGREMMIYLARKLSSEYGQNERVTNLVNNSQIYIMPSMNPDGFEAGRRSNARGKDLNRNFPDFTSDPSDTINGREIETQAIMRLHQEHHFVLALNFHGGAVCFNMPWDTKENSSAATRFGDDPLMSQLALEYAATNPAMLTGGFQQGVTYGYEWYEVDGGMQDWANFYRRSIHATVELSNAKWPAAGNLAQHWRENEEALLAYLEKGVRGAHLEVTDVAGQVLENVSVTVSSAPRRLHYDSGMIHRPTLPMAAQKILIEAEGHEATTLDFDPVHFAGERLRVELAPK